MICSCQAAVGVGGMVAIFFIAFGEMVGVGNLAISARRLGEGNQQQAYATMRRALRLTRGTALRRRAKRIEGRLAWGGVVLLSVALYFYFSR